MKDRIHPTLDDFAKLDPRYIVTGHCTGARAQMQLSEKFPEQHITYGVGTPFQFA